MQVGQQLHPVRVVGIFRDLSCLLLHRDEIAVNDDDLIGPAPQPRFEIPEQARALFVVRIDDLGFLVQAGLDARHLRLLMGQKKHLEAPRGKPRPKEGGNHEHESSVVRFEEGAKREGVETKHDRCKEETRLQTSTLEPSPNEVGWVENWHHARGFKFRFRIWNGPIERFAPWQEDEDQTGQKSTDGKGRNEAGHLNRICVAVQQAVDDETLKGEHQHDREPPRPDGRRATVGLASGTSVLHVGVDFGMPTNTLSHRFALGPNSFPGEVP